LKKINDRDVVDYLSDFADLNSVSVEPHGDWNQLMNSNALEILGLPTVFTGGATFLSEETLKFEFENGTIINNLWLGLYYGLGNEGIIESGQDFYDFYVLGLVDYPDPSNDTSSSIPAPDAPSNSSDNSVPDTPSNSWDNIAYPDPDIAQPDLGGSGVVSGYFLNQSLIGVLSIPSFEEFGDAVGTFSSTCEKFLRHAKKIGLKKIGKSNQL
jgi:hypothetical protein